MNEKGLYQKYKVEHADGSPIDPRAQYLVLRLDAGEYLSACRAGAAAFAEAVEPQNPKLAQGVRDLLCLLKQSVSDGRLSTHYKALWDDYAALEAENKRLLKELDELIAWHEGDDCPRARLEAVAAAAHYLCQMMDGDYYPLTRLRKAIAAAGYAEDE